MLMLVLSVNMPLAMATCGISVGTTLDFGTLAGGAESTQQTLSVQNTGDETAFIDIQGSDWTIGGSGTSYLDVASTKWAVPVTGDENDDVGYDSKTSLDTNAVEFGLLSPSASNSTYWELRADLLEVPPTFDLVQTITFIVTCEP